MLPTREEAITLVKDGLLCNLGPWGRHCLTAAHCAEKIAIACGDMDSEKAYILGLLHDIGRKFGTRHLGHVSDGYTYMKSLGYDEVAQICLTHSFNNHTIDEYIGKFDVLTQELELIKTELAKTVYDEYDLLIQLCDSLAGADGVLDIEERMNDVKKRYGSYPQEKWDANIELKRHFEEKMHQNIYVVCEKDTFVPKEILTGKVVVSACLMGRNCKYSGGNNYNEKLHKWLEGKEVIEVCPEVAGGLPTPRTPVELVNGVATDRDGISRDAEFHLGSRLILQELAKEEIDCVILQSRSPSCGVKQIYDGTFSGQLIPGHGIFAQDLIDKGYKIVDVEDL